MGKIKQTILTYGDYTLDQAKFNKLLEVADLQEQTTLKVLYNAVVKCINDLNANPAAVNVKDWEATRNSYEQYADKLWQKYFPSVPGENETPLDDILAVVEYLTKAGWRIKKSTAYNHRDKGWLRPGADGKYTRAAVDKYAAQKLKRLDGSKKDKIEKMNADRQAAETRRLNALAEREEMKLKILKGNYVDNGSFERELAHRAQLLKNDEESDCRTKAQNRIQLTIDGLEDAAILLFKLKYPIEIISEISKNNIEFIKSKLPDVIEFDLDETAKRLNRYAADREFTVPPPAAEDILSDQEDEGDEGTGE